MSTRTSKTTTHQGISGLGPWGAGPTSGSEAKNARTPDLLHENVGFRFCRSSGLEFRD